MGSICVFKGAETQELFRFFGYQVDINWEKIESRGFKPPEGTTMATLAQIFTIPQSTL